jgi:hypothetical protein
MNRIAALCIALSGLVPIASAQDTGVPDQLSAYVSPDPALGLASADRLFVAYEEFCGRPEVDDERPATVDIDGQTVNVDIFLVAPADDLVCMAPPPPPQRVHTEVGSLPMGLYQVNRRLHVRPAAGGEHTLTSTQALVLQVAGTPHRAVSGAWYDPQNPGTGLFVAIIPRGQIADEEGEVDDRPYAALYLAELNEANQPTWATGLSRFEDSILVAAMVDGGEEVSTRDLVFSYTGCGRATLADAAAPEQVVQLVQLTRVDGMPNCLPAGVE